jgi:hypothetical protein
MAPGVEDLIEAPAPVAIAYSCGACGSRVTIVDGAAIRDCGAHDNMAIHADMTATAYGVGSADPPEAP